MLTRADLDEAVSTGIVTAEQAERLWQLPHERRTERHARTLQDERFVLMRSFNEFFIALGIVLLIAGAWSAAMAWPDASRAIWVLFPLAAWGLAEYLTGRLRLTLPSIVLTLALAVGANFLVLLVIAMVQGDEFVTSLTGGKYIFYRSLGVAVIGVLFYARFRLPFALLVIAAGCVGAVMAAWTVLTGSPSDLSVRVVFLLSGLVILGFALWYDASDRERITRRSDCAFWLTLIAAPLIVHPIAYSILYQNGTDARASALTFIAFLFFAIVALIIDRRAFLVSSLAYLGGAMVYAFTQLGGAQNATWITLIALGAAVILLGVGWQTARGVVMRFVPEPIARYVPIVRT
ncbi:hypothetical protein BH10PSE7_BH10PSE7_16420 [soil metagenome]